MPQKKRTQYISKGIVGHSMRTPETDPFKRLMNQWSAWKKGKNVVLTVPGWEKKAAFIKVNAREVWGDPKAYNKTQIDMG